MRSLIVAYFLLLIPFSLKAQILLNGFCNFIPSDSIYMLSKDGTNFRIKALNINPHILPRSIIPFKNTETINLLKTVKKQKGCLLNSQRSLSLPKFYSNLEKINYASQLLRATSNSIYADSIENLLFNYFLLQANSSDKWESNLAAQTLTDYSSTIAMTLKKSIYLNLYTNSWIHIKTDSLQLSLDVITNMPFYPRVKIRIGEVPSQTAFTLFLRKPFWQTNDLDLYVNGRREFYPLKYGYYQIRRNWNSGDEVFFDFDLTPFIKGKLIQRGPLLYIPTSSPSLPITESDSLNSKQHLLLKGKNFIAYPLIDKSKTN